MQYFFRRKRFNRWVCHNCTTDEDVFIVDDEDPDDNYDDGLPAEVMGWLGFK